MNFESKTLGNKIVDAILVLFFLLLAAVMIVPFMNVVTLSLEPEHIASQTGSLHLFPKEFTLVAYREIFENGSIFNAMKNSLFVTVISVFLSVLFSAMFAFGLSQKTMLSKFAAYLVIFGMSFNAGIIPSYLLMKDLRLLDTLWAVIVPTLLVGYNVVLLRSFIQELPTSLLEAAEIDGCTEVGVFFKIVLPLSKPILATIALFVAVDRWNDFFMPTMYLTSPEKKTLAVVLREILMNATVESGATLELGKNMQMAVTVAAIIPILCVYPFLQKYFTKGIMLGGVKA